MKNKINKKTLLTPLIIMCSLGLIIAGTLSLFTDTTKKEISGKGGKVGIYLSDISLENSENINPGDNDEKISKTYLPSKNDPLYREDSNGSVIPIRKQTTPHDLSFTVENQENKSVRTRQTIRLSVKDEQGNDLSPNVFSLLKTEGVELGSSEKLGDKKYISKNGEKSLNLSDDTTAIEYEILTDIFDGVGSGAEKEDVSTVKDGKKEYAYLLKMDGLAKNEYQGAKVLIDVRVDALQFRNTETKDWETVGSKNVSGKVSGGPHDSLVID